MTNTTIAPNEHEEVTYRQEIGFTHLGTGRVEVHIYSERRADMNFIESLYDQDPDRFKVAILGRRCKEQENYVNVLFYANARAIRDIKLALSSGFRKQIKAQNLA